MNIVNLANYELVRTNVPRKVIDLENYDNIFSAKHKHP